MNLEGQVAVITGAAEGIGRGIAVALAERGARIGCLDIDAASNQATVQLIAEAGSEGLAVDCDVADRVQVRRAISEVLNRFGRIDLLINNAAIWDDSSLLHGSYESQTIAYERSMGVCALGAYFCARACVPAMLTGGGGNIINVITEHIRDEYHIIGQPALGYDCAKFSMWRQVQTWAVELADHNIRVNGLCPGATDTPMLRSAAPARFAEAAMRPSDLGQAVINVLAHGEAGPSGETWLFGPTGTPREESLEVISAIGPGGENA